jgi:hypothetical protein
MDWQKGARYCNFHARLRRFSEHGGTYADVEFGVG